MQEDGRWKPKEMKIFSRRKYNKSKKNAVRNSKLHIHWSHTSKELDYSEKGHRIFINLLKKRKSELHHCIVAWNPILIKKLNKMNFLSSMTMLIKIKRKKGF